jgi:uncharacterized membrane protein (UPF0182 family)
LTSPATAQTPDTRKRGTLVITAVIIAAFVLAFFIFAGLYTDWLWFQQLGFENRAHDAVDRRPP